MNAFAGRHNELTTISLSNVLFSIEKKTLCIWRERNAMALYGAVGGRCMAAQFGTPTGAIGCKIKQTHTRDSTRDTVDFHRQTFQSVAKSPIVDADPPLCGSVPGWRTEYRIRLVSCGIDFQTCGLFMCNSKRINSVRVRAMYANSYKSNRVVCCAVLRHRRQIVLGRRCSMLGFAMHPGVTKPDPCRIYNTHTLARMHRTMGTAGRCALSPVVWY